MTEKNKLTDQALEGISGGAQDNRNKAGGNTRVDYQIIDAKNQKVVGSYGTREEALEVLGDYGPGYVMKEVLVR